VSDPTEPTGDHPLDDLAAYAFDALDDAERQAVDDHLAGCPACRAELAAHHETLAVLTPDEAPPAAVWERVAAGIGAPGLPDPHTTTSVPASPAAPGSEGPDVVGRVSPPTRNGKDVDGTAGASLSLADGDDAGTVASPTSLGDDASAVSAPVGGDADAAVPSLAEARVRRSAGSAGSAGSARPPRFRMAVAAASLAIAAAAGGIVGYAARGSGGDDIGSLAEQASQSPDGVLGTLANSSGRPVARVVSDDDGAFMVLEGLQDLPEGQAYQLWSLEGPQPVSLGMLGREGTNTVAFRLPPTINELAISVEPTSGETAPTSDFQAAGTVSNAD
jgi:hypothetical protein